MSDSEVRMEFVGALGEEFMERLRRGEHPSLNEYKQKHPEFADDIEELFPALAMMEDLAPQDRESLGLDNAKNDSTAAAIEQLGDYRIIREVGRGGMGVVYEAEQVSLGRHVALKVLPSGVLSDSKHVRRFEREAKSAAKLHHTNIVPVFGVGEQDGMHYYVMQFIQGLPLDDVIDELKRFQNQPSRTITSTKPLVKTGPFHRQQSVADVAHSLMTGQFAETQISDSDSDMESSHGMPVDSLPDSQQIDLSSSHLSEALNLSDSLSGSTLKLGKSGVHSTPQKQLTYWQSVANIGAQVADALQYAHEQGILHRDIKPSNLLLDLRGTTWVTDFGLAKATDQQDITHTGDILGTLRYMPPEAFDGMADARSDVYSLGLTLYELLAFQPAFGVKERHQLVKQVTSESAPRLDKLNPHIPRDLVTIVHKAIDRDPAHRYQTAEEMQEDLQRFIDDEPIKARRLSLRERLARWSRHNKGLATSLATVCVLLLIINIAGPLMTLQLVHTNEQLRIAQAQAAKDAQEMAELADAKEIERLRAERNFQRARNTVDTVLTKVSQDELLNQPGLQPIRKELLELALKYYQDFIRERGHDPRLLKDLADAHWRVASITSQIGSSRVALEEYRQAIEIYESLATDANPRDHLMVAYLYGGISRVQRDRGELEEAEESARQAITIYTTLVDQEPDEFEYGRSLAGAYNNLGRIYQAQQQMSDAIISFQEAIARRDKLAELHPNQAWFPIGYNNLANRYSELKRYDKAQTLYEEGIQILQDLIVRYPDNLHYQHTLGDYYINLARLYDETGMTDDALKWHHKAIEIREPLADQNPDVLLYLSRLANSYDSLSQLYSQLGQENEAVSWNEKAIGITEILAKRDADVYGNPSNLLSLARRQAKAGQQAEALVSWQKVRQLIRNLPEPERDADDWGFLGQSLYHLGEFDEAREALEQSISLRDEKEPTLEKGPRWWYLAMALHKLGEPDLARSHYDQLFKELKSFPPEYDSAEYLAETVAVLEIEVTDDLRKLMEIRLGQRSDPDYQPEVAVPAFPAGEGPRVIVDEGHLNFHTINGRFQGFAKLLRSDGYRVGSRASEFTTESLKDVDVLVIANARSTDFPNVEHQPQNDDTASAFNQNEIEALSKWVRDGGSLLLIADHKPYGESARRLGEEFDVEMTGGFVIDEDEPGPIIFQRSDGQLANHPITQGRSTAEHVDQVVSFTGQAFRTTTLKPLLILDTGSVRLPDRPSKLPSDVHRKDVKDWAQGAAGEFGRGRIAVFGEASMFSAQLSGDGRAMGMNAPVARQNEQFLLNVMHWLSREF